MANGKYTYLSWLRKGLASQITQVDQLGGNLSTSYERASLDFSILVKPKNGQIESVQKNFPLLAPADIKLKSFSNIDSLIMPQKGVKNFEPNYFPYIQFYDEDFPWRFSPAKDKNGKLRPWIQLIVLKVDEFEFSGISRANYNTITINKEVPIPNHNEYWLWAHVQIDSSLNEEVNTYGSKSAAIQHIIKNEPSSISSRVLCPRKLEKDTHYHAFLIPAFERGRLAGLEEDIDTNAVSVQQYALQGAKTSDAIRIPTYYSWDFNTARQKGDFEELSKKIKKVEANTFNNGDKELGQRKFSALDVGDGLKYEGKHLSKKGEMQMSGALVVPGSKNKSFLAVNTPKSKVFINQLESYLNTSENLVEKGEALTEIKKQISNLDDDPVIAPPIYGKWHANKYSVDKSKPNNWLNDSNLDPGNRLVAGLGAEVFKENQEDFMAEASPEKLIETSAQVHSKIKFDKISVKRAVAQSKTPNMLLNKTLVQSIKTGSSFAKTKAKTSFGNSKSKYNFSKIAQKGKLNHNHSIKYKNANGIYATSKVSNELTKLISNNTLINKISITPNAKGTVLSNERKNIKSSFVNLRANIIGVTKPLQNNTILNTTKLSNTIATALLPVNVTLSKLNTIIKGTSVVKPSFDPIMAYPIIKQPLYKHLIKKHKDLFIPNLDLFENNSISILKNNQKYIENFLLGFNYEMARELIWREYPTDSKGSYGRFFWDSIIEKNDKNLSLTARANKYSHIQEIHKWSGKSGTNENPKNSLKNSLVVIIRGNLLLKYPNTLIYLQKAKWKSNTKQLPRKLDESESGLFPTYNAFIGPDIHILGFDISAEEAKGSIQTNGKPGHFLILQEPPGENKFGIDVAKDSDNITSWSDLAWDHFKAETDYVNITDYQNNKKNINGVKWAENSNHMANIFNQRPFKMAIHAEKLI